MPTWDIGFDQSGYLDALNLSHAHSLASLTLDTGDKVSPKDLEHIHTLYATKALGEWMYFKENSAALATNDDNLSIAFSLLGYENVLTDNDIYEDQNAAANYSVFLFKDYNLATGQGISVEFIGKSTEAPSSQKVTLQVFNQNTRTWATLASNTIAGADIEFTLQGSVAINPEDYYDPDKFVSCRVYQQAP